MMTFQESYDRYTAITKDSSTTNVALGKALVNEYNQQICGMRDWIFMEKERTVNAVASQTYYRLPADFGRLIDFWAVVNSQTYYPSEVHSQEYWRYLQSNTSTSDIPTNFIIYSDHLGVYPTPATTAPLYHMLYKRKAVEMTAADYTTGTISVTGGLRAVTGALTVWTSAMTGRWIKINGYWYEITSIDSGTTLTLEKPALSTAANVTYKIGEVSPIPDEYHDLLWKGPVADYFDFKALKNPWRSQYEQRLGIGRYATLDSSLVYNYGNGQKSTTQVIKSRVAGRLTNPNYYPTGMV